MPGHRRTTQEGVSWTSRTCRTGPDIGREAGPGWASSPFSRKDVSFHIGRAQISTVDLATKTMTVRRDGGTVAARDEYDIPDVPHTQRRTTSGTFVHGDYRAATSVFGHQNAALQQGGVASSGELR